MKSWLKDILARFGYRISRATPTEAPDSAETLFDLTEDEREIVRTAQPLTMTGPARLATLVQAVTHIVRKNIPGDIAECGVWRGGSMVAVARTLLSLGDTSRRLYLYDTFDGMTQPTERDQDFAGASAASQLERDAPGTGVWASASLEDVKSNLLATGYPADQIVFVPGRVEDTIPATMPETLALLRLDTDWYGSTRHELMHLYPILSQFGVLIIDDYGHWQGAREATDEFLRMLHQPLYLHRIDYTARLAVKT